MEEASSNRRPPSPTPTCVSMKSDWSMDPPLNFKGGNSSTGHSIQWKASHTPDFKERDCPGEYSNQPGPITVDMQRIHKAHLQEKFQCLIEGNTNQGIPTALSKVYTDLYTTEGGTGEVNNEHEVRQIERASWREAAHDRPIKCSDIFKPLSGQDKPKTIRTVLTKGVAGIGKTVSVQKFLLDWAEGKANQDVHFIFPLPFRELNLMKEKKLSLVDLIQTFFSYIKDPEIFSTPKHRVMFIFDGLDECRLPLDFRSNPRCCDVTEPVSVDVLLTNLIQGNLLPSALLWITTRPAATNQIPPECVDRVTEIRGFNDPQKEEYFTKKFSDENLASRTITHLKSSRSLYIMCHIPVFCWISATVVGKTSDDPEKVEMPRTLTQMYTHYLTIQTSIKKGKYTGRKETDEEVIFKLGKLAFQQLEKGNLIFYEEDLRECGIDVTEASVYSGVCTQIFREEAGLYQGKVFSFVHLSIQEFLAALYVFLCFSNRERNMPDQQQISQLSALFRAATLQDLHETAVDLALQSRNGHLDLFLRFLLGLSLESNQNHLRHLLPQTSSQSQSSEQTVQYVKQRLRAAAIDDDVNLDNYFFANENNSHKNIKIRAAADDDDRKINLFYCLNELNHHAVVEETDRSSGTLSVVMLLPGQWKTRRFTFQMSEEQLDEFDLQKCIKTPEEDLTELLSPDEVLQKLLPVVTSALLECCNLTEKSCSYLTSVLTSHSSRLRELNLSHNQLLDSGVELLCSGLQHQNCKLETLQLWDCNLTEKSCSYLTSVLTSHSSRLRELNLRLNNLRASDVEQLSALVKDPNCKLEKLKVDGRTFRKESPAAAAASSSTSSSLSSDAAKLHLRDEAQEQKQRRKCQSCTHIPDPGHWVLVTSSVSMETGECVYSVISPAGNYECSESGLRWSCAGPVTMQYRFRKEELFWDQLQVLGYRPAGPLMDIRLLSGELEEVHLPHFLCLDGSDPSALGDAVRALHGDDSGVSLETCELSRFHGRLPARSFSLWQLVVSLGIPVKSHCEVLIYQSCPKPLILNTFLVPTPSTARQQVEERWRSRGALSVKSPPDHSLWLRTSFQLHTSCSSEIMPRLMTLTYKTAPTFFEVCLKSPPEDFTMELRTAEENRPVWAAVMRRGADYLRTRDQAGPSGTHTEPEVAAGFVDDHRAELIRRVGEVMPIADELLSQRVISQETYSSIQAAPTSQAKMRALYEGLHSAGAKGKLAFYRVLQAQQCLLVEDLWTA